MRTSRPLFCGVAALAVLLAGAAAPAEARTKRFRPLDLTPAVTGSDYIRSPVSVGSLSGTVGFTAQLGLPAGARITGIRIYSGGAAATRDVVVRKARLGEPSVLMASASEAAAHADPFTPLLTEGTAAASPPDSVVEPGYYYAVLVNCAPGTSVWAVDVDYTP